MVYHFKWNNVVTVTCETLYIGLYGPITCKYWQEKDNLPLDPKTILFPLEGIEYGSYAYHKDAISIIWILQYYSAHLEHQASSAYPVYNDPVEDMDHLLTYPDITATTTFVQGILLNQLKDKLKIAPAIKEALSGSLGRVRRHQIPQ